jgi:hypothetical protein
MRFEVPTTVLVIVHVSWDVALFLLVNIYAHLGRVQCLQLEDRQSKKSNVKFICAYHDGDYTVLRTALVNSIRKMKGDGKDKTSLVLMKII